MRQLRKGPNKVEHVDFDTGGTLPDRGQFDPDSEWTRYIRFFFHEYSLGLTDFLFQLL